MHVQFEFTEDEMVDASRRFLARSGALRSIRWKDTLYVSLAAGVIPLLFFLDRPIMGVTIGGLAALVSAALYRTTGEKEYEKRIRKLSREVLGGRGPHLCEVELSAVGVWVRQGHKQITYEWEGVEEVREAEDSVDIYTRDGGGVIVRKRAFNSPEEQRRFADLARGYVELSRVGGSDQAPQLTNG